MKKSIVIVIILLTIIFCNSAVVVLMAMGIIQKGDNTDDGIFIESSENATNYIRTCLTKSAVDITEDLAGVVYPSEHAQTEYRIEKVNTVFKLHTSVGVYVEKGMPLYTDINGKVVNAPTNLVVSNIIIDDGFYMETFSYDNMVIMINILEKYQNKIHELSFTTLNDNGETIELELSYIDTFVTDGRIGVALKCPFKLLENSTVNVLVKYDTVDDKVSIPIEFVMFDDSGVPYVHVVDGEEVEDCYLDVYSYNDASYIVNNDLGGCFVGFTQEEKYFNKQ